MTELVGLVIVSHSAKLAAGVVELAGQMAPGVALVAAGGMPDGRLGTDFDAVSAAIADADRGAGVVLLFDLGSARMTADLAVETMDDPSMTVVAEAPLVEGAVAAAVAAAGGADLMAVVAAAIDAGSNDEQTDEQTAPDPDDAQQADVVLTNEVGLHARPAAVLARAMAALDAAVTIRLGDKEADARSVLALLGLAARKGDTLQVSATGDQATEALDRVARLAAHDFESTWALDRPVRPMPATDLGQDGTPVRCPTSQSGARDDRDDRDDPVGCVRCGHRDGGRAAGRL
jgi:PTS hybrid protein